MDVFLRIKAKPVGCFQIVHTDILLLGRVYTVEKGTGVYDYEHFGDPERSGLIFIGLL